jgi:hypothetical protein
MATSLWSQYRDIMVLLLEIKFEIHCYLVTSGPY